MKKIFLLFVIISILSCKTEVTKHSKPKFLIGKWIRLNEKDSVITTETWSKDFTGKGLSIKNKDTTFFEKLEILSKNDTLYLSVSGVNEKPTLFKFINQTDTSFTCVNLKNEFPQKITYYLENKLLKAKVSNREFSIDFTFKKLKK